MKNTEKNTRILVSKYFQNKWLKNYYFCSNNWKNMALNEKEMTFLEAYIPELTEKATQRAYFEALSAGHSVVISEGDQIIEVFPDGIRKVVKQLHNATVKATRKTYKII